MKVHVTFGASDLLSSSSWALIFTTDISKLQTVVLGDHVKC